MELSFRTIQKGEDLETVLRVKSETGTDFTGHTTVETTSSIIVTTDTFNVVKKTDSKVDSAGIFYDWYIVKDHYRSESRFTLDREEELKKQRSDIDYVALMADIDLEEA
jgi:hypothetical protein